MFAAVIQFSPSAARGGEELRINQLSVSVWPEYDDPRILVIYRGAFAEESVFPAWVDFYIPEGSEIIGAGKTTPQGELLLQEYNIHEERGRQVISINLSTPTFFLEYYHDPFSGKTQKSFEQRIENKYPVDSLTVAVQQPLKAESFTLAPQADSRRTDTQGFSDHLYDFQDLAAESSVKISVSYKKDDPNPSMPRQTTAQQGAGEAPYGDGETAPDVKTGMSGVTFTGIILLAAAVVVAAAFIMRKKAEKRVENSRGPHERTAGREGWKFCPCCGAELKKDYRFCPSCGHSLKRGN